MKRSHFVLICILLSWQSGVIAQEVIVKAELDTNRALIGDQLKLHLTVEKPAKLQVEFPAFIDTLSKNIEIISSIPPDTSSAADGRQLIRKDLLIAVFDTGFFEIPQFDFVINAGTNTDTLSTLPVYFEIISVKLDSTIRDIKAIEKVPIGFRDLYPYLSAILVLAILVWLLLRYVKKRQSSIVRTSPDVPVEQPEVIALQALGKIKAEKPWMHHMVKYYHIRLSEILRSYIEGRLNIMAMEQTTDEILASLKPLISDISDFKTLEGILKLSDLVKFAKAVPDENENAAQVDLAIDFVKHTSTHRNDNGQPANNQTLVTDKNMNENA
jgi:hypothetical protein